MSSRPTFAATIAALTVEHPDYGNLHTEEEADVAELLIHIETKHQGAEEPDSSGRWGTCGLCRVPWPCPAWVDAEQLAVQFLGRAQDRVWAHAEKTREARSGRSRCPAVHPIAGTFCARPPGHTGVHSGSIGDPWQSDRL